MGVLMQDLMQEVWHGGAGLHTCLYGYGRGAGL